MHLLYTIGCKTAANAVGLSTRLHNSLMRLLEGPAGEHIVRLPIASALSAGASYGIGKRLGSKNPERQAAIGAVLPVLGTTATLSALPLRQHLLKALK